MPKRRMTFARKRQIEQWRLAGSRASHKNKTPHGKTLALFHGTSPQRADIIVKKGFTNPFGAEFFSTRLHGKGQGAAVEVKVPYKKATHLGSHGLYSVTVKNLRGRKIKKALV